MGLIGYYVFVTCKKYRIRKKISNRKLKKVSTIIKYKLQMDKNTCVICQEDFSKRDKIRVLQCDHHFHKKCIDKWFESSCRCPLCNNNLNKQDENI